MEMPDYSDYDGLGLAELVAKRAVTPLGAGRGRHRADRAAQPDAERRGLQGL